MKKEEIRQTVANMYKLGEEYAKEQGRNFFAELKDYDSLSGNIAFNLRYYYNQPKAKRYTVEQLKKAAADILAVTKQAS